MDFPYHKLTDAQLDRMFWEWQKHIERIAKFRRELKLVEFKGKVCVRCGREKIEMCAECAAGFAKLEKMKEIEQREIERGRPMLDEFERRKKQFV